MNEELEQLLQEIKSTLPWLLVVGLAVASYYGVKHYMADRRAAASEAVASSYTTDELEDAVSKFGRSDAAGALKLRLAKSYYDAANYESALDIYDAYVKDGNAPDGFADVPPVGRAQCLEALGKFAEATEAYDAFAAANPASFLALTAQLGAARCVARAGDREKAVARLEALKAATTNDELSVSRIDTTIDLVKRYEKRAERSLFEAADAAQKQLEDEAAKPAPEAEKPAADPAPTPEKPAAEKAE